MFPDQERVQNPLTDECVNDLIQNILQPVIGVNKHKLLLWNQIGDKVLV